MNEITIGDKVYISSKRAAEITGYAKDYVGQLCREGHIEAKMVGRGWYVYEPSIRAHRFGEESIEDEAAREEISYEGMKVDNVTPSDSPVEPVDAWEKAKYTSEEPQTLPELPKQAYEELLPPAEETITDMQEAWKEWFERKQEVLKTPELETEEVIDARNADLVEEVEEVEIPLHRIEEDEYDEIVEENEEVELEPENISIRHIPEPVTPVQARNVTHMDVAPLPASQYVYERAEPQVVEHGRIVNERIVPKQKSKKAKKGRVASNGSSAPVIALLVSVSLITIAVTVIGLGLVDKYIKSYSNQNNQIVNFIVGTREFKR